MSGESNVVFWLQEHGIEPHRELVAAIFQRAKQAETVLSEAEIAAVCSEQGLALPP